MVHLMQHLSRSISSLLGQDVAALLLSPLAYAQPMVCEPDNPSSIFTNALTSVTAAMCDLIVHRSEESLMDPSSQLSLILVMFL